MRVANKYFYYYYKFEIQRTFIRLVIGAKIGMSHKPPYKEVTREQGDLSKPKDAAQHDTQECPIWLNGHSA